jgi:hypothetical protein
VQDLYAQQLLGVPRKNNLLLGSWGHVIVTPIYMVTNTVTYVSGARKLRGAVE